MTIFLAGHQTPDHIFDENEIGAPNTRDCFTLAKRLLRDIGVPKGTQGTAHLKDGTFHLASETFTL